MKKILLYTLASLLFWACGSEEKVTKKVGEGEIKLDENFGKVSADKKYEVEGVKIEASLIDGGVHFNTKKKKTFLSKKSLDFFWVKNQSKKELLNKVLLLQNTLKAQKLIGFTSKFSSIQFKDTVADVYFQEGFQKHIVESSKNREGILFTVEGKDVKIQFVPKRTSDQKISDLKSLVATYFEGSATQCTFDWNKSITIVSTIQAFGLRGENDIQLCYYLNPVSNLIEPIPFYAPNNKTDELRLKLAGDEAFNYSLSFNENQVKVANELGGNTKSFAAQKYVSDTVSCYSSEKFEQYFEQKEGVYQLKSDKVEITENVIAPKGIQIEFKAGQEVNFLEGGFILSFSPVKIEGTKFFSTDSTGRGLHVINARGESSIVNAEFNGLRNLEFESWKLPSAVTFYESPIKIKDTKFLNNQSEDGLNLFRCDGFVVDGAVFQNTFSDAFDADFSDGTLSNCEFIDLGNDGIDVSGSKIVVTGCTFKNVADKALSSGEASSMDVDSISIDGASLAITAKDNSSIDIKNSSITNSEVVFCAFQKKKEFGPSHITGEKVTYSDSKKDYLIEKKSSLKLDGKAIEKYEKSVRDILYGNEFGKATVK